MKVYVYHHSGREFEETLSTMSDSENEKTQTWGITPAIFGDVCNSVNQLYNT